MLGKGIANGKNKDFYNLIGKKYLNKKSFPYGKKINFNSIRKGSVIGEHEVKFSSGKEIVTLNHESFDRALSKDSWFKVTISFPLENFTSCSPITLPFRIELKFIFLP